MPDTANDKGWVNLDIEQYRNNPQEEVEVIIEDDDEEDIVENQNVSEEDQDLPEEDIPSDPDQDDSDDDEDETASKKVKKEKSRKGSRAQRRIQTLANRNKELENQLKQLQAQNDESATALEESQKATATVVKQTLESRLKDIDSQIQSSSEEGDTAKAVQLTLERDKVSKQLDEVTNLKLPKRETKKVSEEPKPLTQEEQIAKFPIAGQEWIYDHPEIFTDQVFAVRAASYGRALEAEGYSSDSDEYWEKLTEKLEGETQTKSPRKKRKRTSPVNNSSRASKASTKKTVKLSKEQVEMANRLGVDTDTYGKRVLEMEQADTANGYTPIAIPGRG